MLNSADCVIRLARAFSIPICNTMFVNSINDVACDNQFYKLYGWRPCRRCHLCCAGARQ